MICYIDVTFHAGLTVCTKRISQRSWEAVSFKVSSIIFSLGWRHLVFNETGHWWRSFTCRTPFFVGMSRYGKYEETSIAGRIRLIICTTQSQWRFRGSDNVASLMHTKSYFPQKISPQMEVCFSSTVGYKKRCVFTLLLQTLWHFDETIVWIKNDM